ncbi:MAG: response regulator [Faecousia sp.]
MQDTIRVMIVDDERLAIEDLRTIVDWQALGFEIVATAFNGTQAFTKFLQLRPQVIITDIKMPFMDGIELIRRIREVDQQVLLLLLTAYEDFSYARCAIRQGITDYIIKSEITPQRMTELLQKLRVLVDEQRKKRTILTDTIVETFFALPTAPVTREAEEMLRRLFAFAVVEQTTPLMLNGGQEPLMDRLPQAEIKQLLRMQSYPDMKFVAASTLSEQRTLLVLESSNNSAFYTYDCLNRSAIMLQGVLAQKSATPFTFYVAMRPMTAYDLRQFLQNNPEVFRRKYFKREKELILLERLPMPEAAAPAFDASRFVALLEQGDETAATAFLKELYEAIIASGDYHCLLSVSREVYFLLLRMSQTLPERLLRPDLSAENNWRQWINAETICRWLTEKTGQLIARMNENRENAYSRTVSDAIAFVHTHYAQAELSLNDIADELHISVGHLCALFKQETGVTLKNYITDVRIEAAKRLLRTSHEKIYAVCTAVGYQSSQYFSQVFYKKVGMYPAEYRKGGRSEE